MAEIGYSDGTEKNQGGSISREPNTNNDLNYIVYNSATGFVDCLFYGNVREDLLTRSLKVDDATLLVGSVTYDSVTDKTFARFAAGPVILAAGEQYACEFPVASAPSYGKIEAGSGFTAAIAQPARVGSNVAAGYSQRSIGAWDYQQYDTITEPTVIWFYARHMPSKESYDAGLKHGMESVTFTVNNGTPIVSEPQYNSAGQYWGFPVLIDPADYANGFYEMRCVAKPIDGEPLVMQGSTRYNPATPSFWFSVGPRMVVYVDSVNGNDTTGSGAIGAPYKTVLKSLQAISAAQGGDVGGGITRLMPGEYKLGIAENVTFNAPTRYWTIEPAPGVDPQDIIFTSDDGNGFRTQRVHIKGFNTSLTLRGSATGWDGEHTAFSENIKYTSPANTSAYNGVVHWNEFRGGIYGKNCESINSYYGFSTYRWIRDAIIRDCGSEAVRNTRSAFNIQMYAFNQFIHPTDPKLNAHPDIIQLFRHPEAADVLNDLKAYAGSRTSVTVHYTTTDTPPTATGEGDIWIKKHLIEHDFWMGGRIYTGGAWTSIEPKFVSGAWVAPLFSDSRMVAIYSIQQFIKGGAEQLTTNKLFYQTAAPTTGMALGDLWMGAGIVYGRKATEWVALNSDADYFGGAVLAGSGIAAGITNYVYHRVNSVQPSNSQLIFLKNGFMQNNIAVEDSHLVQSAERNDWLVHGGDVVNHFYAFGSTLRGGGVYQTNGKVRALAAEADFFPPDKSLPGGSTLYPIKPKFEFSSPSNLSGVTQTGGGTYYYVDDATGYMTSATGRIIEKQSLLYVPVSTTNRVVSGTLTATGGAYTTVLGSTVNSILNVSGLGTFTANSANSVHQTITPTIVASQIAENTTYFTAGHMTKGSAQYVYFRVNDNYLPTELAGKGYIAYDWETGEFHLGDACIDGGVFVYNEENVRLWFTYTTKTGTFSQVGPVSAGVIPSLTHNINSAWTTTGTEVLYFFRPQMSIGTMYTPWTGWGGTPTTVPGAVLTLDWASRGIADGTRTMRYSFRDKAPITRTEVVTSGFTTLPIDLPSRYITSIEVLS